ncbi:MAG: 4Fe-4S binding protein, partial [Candidatus Bipolaricaulia bacterium]
GEIKMIRRSTRMLWKAGRKLRGYSLADFLHGYVYTRWPYHYIGLATGERSAPRLLRPFVALLAALFARSDERQGANSKKAYADRYHGKVVPTAAAEMLVTLDRPIELRGLEQIIPYATARDIVMQDPDHIVALECPCRSVREDPCLPLDVCLIVGEPFASFVADHHPEKARWISQSEAVEILRAERDRGHVHHAFFKDAMLGRFYAICNCCSCCCGAMQAWRSGTPMLASSGYVSMVDPERCTGCGACAEACPFDAIHVDEGVASVDGARCMGCGVCVANCPRQSLSLVRDLDKSEPLEIRKLISSDVVS